jgi:hypothetical protein
MKKPPDSSNGGVTRKMRISRPIPSATRGEPTDEELISLIEGTLTEEQRRALEVQLSQCPYSADRVAIIRAALEAAGVEVPAAWRSDAN